MRVFDGLHFTLGCILIYFVLRSVKSESEFDSYSSSDLSQDPEPVPDRPQNIADFDVKYDKSFIKTMDHTQTLDLHGELPVSYDRYRDLTDFPNYLSFNATVTVFLSSSVASRLNINSIRALATSIYGALSLVNFGISDTSFIRLNSQWQRIVSSTTSRNRIIYTIEVDYIILAYESTSLYTSYNSFVTTYTRTKCCWTAAQLFYNTAKAADSSGFILTTNISTVAFEYNGIANTSPVPTRFPTIRPSANPTVIPTTDPTSIPTINPTLAPVESVSSSTSIDVYIVVIIAVFAVVFPAAFMFVYFRLKSGSRRGRYAATSRAVVAENMNIVDLDAAPVDVVPTEILVLPDDLDPGTILGSRAPLSVQTAVPSVASVTLTDIDGRSIPLQSSIRRSPSGRVTSSPRSPSSRISLPTNDIDISNETNEPVSSPSEYDPCTSVMNIFPATFSLQNIGLEWLDQTPTSPNGSINSESPKV